MRVYKFKLVEMKFKIQFLSHSSRISSVQEPLVYTQKTFPSLQKVLLEITGTGWTQGPYEACHGLLGPDLGLDGHLDLLLYFIHTTVGRFLFKQIFHSVWNKIQIFGGPTGYPIAPLLLTSSSSHSILPSH